MIRKIIDYIFPPKSKFRKGDAVIIDNKHIHYIFNYNPTHTYTGKIVKTFLATKIDDRDVYIYLVHLDFLTSFKEMWCTENKLSFLSKMDDRDYKLNSLLEI
jgi:hypothetical protein